MRVVWTADARADLRRIQNYIGNVNPLAAERIKRRVVESTRQLTEFPQSGRAVERRGMRLLVVAGLPYLILYCVRHDLVDIQAVLDGRMDRDTDLF